MPEHGVTLEQTCDRCCGDIYRSIDQAGIEPILWARIVFERMLQMKLKIQFGKDASWIISAPRGPIPDSFGKVRHHLHIRSKDGREKQFGEWFENGQHPQDGVLLVKALLAKICPDADVSEIEARK